MSYRIGRLAELSGFDTTVLRAWERRHKLLHPERLENGYRLYTEQDLALLRRVRVLLDEGYSIGDVVRRLEDERTEGGAPADDTRAVDLLDGRHPEISWAILDALPLAVLVTDPQGRVRWANRGVDALCGYQLPELHGRTPGAVLQGEGSDAGEILRMRAAIAERRPYRARVLNFHKSGEPYTADVSIAPLHIGLEVVGFVSTARRADEPA